MGQAVAALCWVLVLAAIPVGVIVVDGRLVAEVDSPQPRLLVHVGAATIAGVWVWLLVATVRSVVEVWRTRRRTGLRVPVPLHTTVTAATSALVMLANALITTRSGPPTTPPADPSVGTTTPAAQPPAAPPLPPQQPTVVGDGLSWGWLPAPAAGAASATIALLWAHRRRHYQPRPPTTAPHSDTSLIPGLPGLGSLLDQPTPDLPDRVSTPPPAGPVIGTTVGGWLTLDQVPDTLTLTGPGAANAARAILATIATHHAPHPDTAPLLTLTRTDLVQLLGADPDTTVPGIHLSTTTPPLTTAPIPGAITLALRAPGATPRTARDSQVVLARTGARLDSAVTTTTWHVTTDGQIQTRPGFAPSTGPLPSTRDSRRLAVLDRDAARTLLGNAAALAAALTNPPPADPTPTTPTAAPQAVPEDVDAGVIAAPTSGTSTAPVMPDPATVLPVPDSLHRLQVRLLGPPAVLVREADGTVRPVRIRRTAATQLLIYLAVHRDGATSDQLKEALWPDTSISSAKGLLRTNLSALRTTLRTAAGEPVLHTINDPAAPGRSHHWLDPDQITIDLWTLHEFLHRASTTTDSTHRRQLLDTAAGLATGTLATGHVADWLTPHRETTTDTLTDLLHHLADNTPDQHTALTLLRRALHIAPDTMHLHEALTRRTTAHGGPATGDHLGTAVQPRVTGLHPEPAGPSQLLSAGPTPDAPPPATTDPSATGNRSAPREHR